MIIKNKQLRNINTESSSQMFAYLFFVQLIVQFPTNEKANIL